MIVLEDVRIDQGKFTLNHLHLNVPTGQYAVLMGRTGCGKTTILEVVAGLRTAQQGKVLLDGREVTRWAPGERGVGYVPQDGALFKTLTVYDQIAFALTIRGYSEDHISSRVHDLARWLNLEHLLDRRPQGLSGGEAQRIALGRALAFQPRILLLDEPLSSLDEDTRFQLMELLQNLRQSHVLTVLHVTHHPGEARQLGDVVYRLENGKLELVEKTPSTTGGRHSSVSAIRTFKELGGPTPPSPPDQ